MPKRRRAATAPREFKTEIGCSRVGELPATRRGTGQLAHSLCAAQLHLPILVPRAQFAERGGAHCTATTEQLEAATQTLTRLDRSSHSTLLQLDLNDVKRRSRWGIRLSCSSRFLRLVSARWLAVNSCYYQHHRRHLDIPSRSCSSETLGWASPRYEGATSLAPSLALIELQLGLISWQRAWKWMGPKYHSVFGIQQVSMMTALR